MIPLGRVMQRISTNTQTEIANFSGLLGRVLTEMRLVKVSNTERLELDNAHVNLKKIYHLGLKQAKISAIVQPISGVVMLLYDCDYSWIWCIRNRNRCYYTRYINCNDFLCDSIIYAIDQSIYFGYRL